MDLTQLHKILADLGAAEAVNLLVRLDKHIQSIEAEAEQKASVFAERLKQAADREAALKTEVQSLKHENAIQKGELDRLEAHPEVRAKKLAKLQADQDRLTQQIQALKAK